MTHCAKCGAELIGSRKFCAACGTPAGDPRSPAASTGLAPMASGHVPAASGSGPASSPGSGPSIQYAPAPASQVNPFAQTAGPATNKPRASDYGPPPASVPAVLGTTTPGVGDPSAAPQVSPLAVSNVLSHRGAFENAVTAGPASVQAVSAGLFPQGADGDASSSGVKRGGVPGTQMMPSVANPPAPSGATPAGGAPAAGPPAPSKRQDRTQLLGALPAGSIPRPGVPSAGAPSASAPSGGAASAGQIPAARAPARQPSDPGASASGQRISSTPNVGSGPSLPSAQSPYAPPPPIAQPQPPIAQPQPQPQPPMAQPQPPMPPPTPYAQPAPYPQAAPYAQPQQPPMPAPAPYAQPAPYPQPIPTPGAWNPAASPYIPPQQPAMPYAAPPYGVPQPPPPPPVQYGFGYAPGSRVTVTWSTGARYPGTVQQVSGTQCLVVFPDGQHHWVEMQYLAPG